MTEILLGAVALAITLSSCHWATRGCLPTSLQARDAAAVDTGDVARDGLLEASLSTTGGRPLPGRFILFRVNERDLVSGRERMVSVGGERTDADGWASVDLNTLPVGDRARAFTADRHAAAFGGDRRFCRSAGSAKFMTLRARMWTAPQRVPLPHSPDPAPNEVVVPAPPVEPRTPADGCRNARDLVRDLPNVELCFPG